MRLFAKIRLLCFFTILPCGFAKNTRNSTDSQKETAKFIRGLDRILDVTTEYVKDYSNLIGPKFELTHLTRKAASEYLNIQKDYSSSLFGYFKNPISPGNNETLELDFLRYRYKCLAYENFKPAHQWDYWNRNNSEFASNLRFFYRSIEGLFSATSDRVSWTVKKFVKRSSDSKQGISLTLKRFEQQLVCPNVTSLKQIRNMSLRVSSRCLQFEALRLAQFNTTQIGEYVEAVLDDLIELILATVLYAPLQRLPQETKLAEIIKYTKEQLDSSIRCVDKIERFFKTFPHD
ncbi:hypothetical protein M3Y96_00411500 [Aphelenchoides besseyi]|nr:hypothetical protein M3Y96_00411500 [Aphelenchoides besseyi]